MITELAMSVQEANTLVFEIQASIRLESLRGAYTDATFENRSFGTPPHPPSIHLRLLQIPSAK